MDDLISYGGKMKKLFRLIYTLTYFVSLLPLKLYDLCHGTEFSGMEHNKDTDGRYSYSPSSLFSFPQIKKYIRRYLSNGHGHGILDIGCGKGFVLHFFSSFDFDTVSGIEYNDDLCRTARRNLSCGTKNITVYHGDATKFLRYADYDSFYLYNPFDQDTLELCIRRILSTLKDNPRRLTIIYCNPLYKDVLIKHGFRAVKHFYYKTTIYIL